jgi:hypothetical protein
MNEDTPDEKLNVACKNYILNVGIKILTIYLNRLFSLHDV